MSMIRLNLTTKEMEIKGSESFADDIFSKIQDLVTENQGIMETRLLRKKRNVPEALKSEREEPKIDRMVKTSELDKASLPGIAVIPREMERKRPPVRKYILRKAGTSSPNTSIASLPKEDTGRISLVSLKEKSGLTEQQIEAIIKDAEKQGRIRREMDGSYTWV